ncbi:hypothetical protein BST97_03465 [Nonlabens spongiae]|uniref:Uncharacterized protein n=1 Tax=Nonlabens spongiae TaxID=331648 RepID=A0A1W6MHR1_9FLAO|nr:hypothetical protein BST97_03465 [Nonlabens spongiae]
MKPSHEPDELPWKTRLIYVSGYTFLTCILYFLARYYILEDPIGWKEGLFFTSFLFIGYLTFSKYFIKPKKNKP